MARQASPPAAVRIRFNHFILLPFAFSLMFDPSYPPEDAEIESSPLRSQFNGLKALIDAILTLTSAQVDATNTLAPGNPALVTTSVTGNTLHLTFGIPQGEIGPQGPEGQQGIPGPPGEVTLADLNNAIATALQLTSNNSNGVGALGLTADGSYQQWQLQAVSDKLDQLINALFRAPPGP